MGAWNADAMDAWIILGFKAGVDMLAARQQ
jgi:hypothetical protein